ncbi:hypothetical protein MPSEU_000894500 [Mayamaea pseudoterrestris]|nr:hypothetical protein MPSEU_000894500 [Mayamaea pseudoterrestris]
MKQAELFIRALTISCLPWLVVSSQQYSRLATFSSSSAKPWRPSSQSVGREDITIRQQMYSKDYSSYFLDQEDWITDTKARSYSFHRRRTRPNQATITSRLTLINVATYLAQVIRPSLTAWGVKISNKILSGQELHRVITPMFLHGGLFHLFTNSQSLGNAGPSIEQIFGPGRFLATYLVSGIAGNLFSAYMSPNPSLGASGAVLGVISAYLVFLNRHEWLLGREGADMSTSIGATLLINVGMGFVMPMIDNYGHLGGAMGGAAMSYYFGPRLYYSDMMDGTRLLVDRPIVRLPRHIESIPEVVIKRISRMTRQIHVGRFTMDLPNKPWRRTRQTPRRWAPNRSIKPRNPP